MDGWIAILRFYIYILSVFTEKPNGIPLERNIVYIPIFDSWSIYWKALK